MHEKLISRGHDEEDKALIAVFSTCAAVAPWFQLLGN